MQGPQSDQLRVCWCSQLIKVAAHLGEGLNAARANRGLKARAVRACVVGFPNVGKSALINRLLGRRLAESAAKPGVTRSLRWMRVGGSLDLLDAPGMCQRLHPHTCLVALAW